MRHRIRQGGLTINVVAGTHVVFFGLDVVRSRRRRLRGFGFLRRDHVTGETVWLRGIKTFEKTEPHPARGETFSTRDHPVQSFQWADYGVEPGRDYTYTVVALYGDPAALEPRNSVDIAITTEAATGATHSAFFNRGSVASQEYARRFQNQPPNVAGQGAYDWLSRGLLEALVAFIGRAEQGWSVHGAVYEFQWPAALAALKQARQHGAVVNVLFDDIEASSNGKPVGPWQKNRTAIATARIKSICHGRTHGKLMHNKFFVLSRNGKPVAVWTGSTNLTENGIFGHSNLGHIVEDAAVATTFLDYWKRLAADPPIDKSYRAANVTATPVPPPPWSAGTTTVVSPRGTDLDALDWYAQLAGEARGALFMTFAFGMEQRFKDVYRRDDAVLRMALMETAGGGATDKTDIQAIRNRPNVVVAIGNRIVTNAFDRWLAEMAQVTGNVHVRWIHTKYLLADPLGPDPVVVTGSANFSKASTDTNDENMLVIRGDRRIADIYFGEFLRLYSHYAFREAVKRHTEQPGSGGPDTWQPQFLVDDDNWMTPHFDPADRGARFARRVYFAGAMAT